MEWIEMFAKLKSFEIIIGWVFGGLLLLLLLGLFISDTIWPWAVIEWYAMVRKIKQFLHIRDS